MKSNIFKNLKGIELVKFGVFAMALLFCQSGFSQTARNYSDLIPQIYKKGLVTLFTEKHYLKKGDGIAQQLDLDFKGESVYFPTVPLQDKISGMFISQGLYVVAYEHPGKEGARWTFSSGYYPDLWKSNQCISSMEVFIDKNDPHNGTGIPENAAILYESNNPKSADVWNRSHGLIPDAKYLSEWSEIGGIDVEDTFKYLYVKGSYRVTLYEHKDHSGSSETFKDVNRGEGTWYNLDKYGLRDRVSSAVVEGGKYAVTGFDFGPSTIGDPKFGESNVISAIFDNRRSDSRGDANLSLVKGKEQTWSLAKSLETTVGASTSIEFSNEGSLSAVVAGSYTASFTASIETAVGSSEEKGTAEYEEAGTSVTVDPDGGCIGGARMVFTPITSKFEVTLTYSEVDGQGNKIPGGHSYTRSNMLTINSSDHGVIEKHSFCPKDVAEKMVNNAWAVRGAADSNLKGGFAKIPNSDNLKWTNANGHSLTLTPDFENICYKSSDGKTFNFYTFKGELESFGYNGKKYYETEAAEVVSTGGNSGGGDLTGKGDVEELLLSKTFKLQNPTNGYHEGSFTKLSNGNLEWKNKAGIKWALKPMYAANYLDTTVGDCFYRTQPGGDKFVLIMENGQLKGFKFMRDTFYVN